MKGLQGGADPPPLPMTDRQLVPGVATAAFPVQQRLRQIHRLLPQVVEGGLAAHVVLSPLQEQPATAEGFQLIVVKLENNQFLGLAESDPLVRGTDPALDPSLDPSIIKPK